MDHFMEEVVVKKQKGFQNAVYYLSGVLMVVMAIIGLFILSNLLMAFNLIDLAIVLIFLGCAVLLYLKKDTLRTEYEYTFTNGELDFAKVFNNQKRKSLGTLRVKNVESFGPVEGEAFRKLINMPGLTRNNWFLNRDAALYYFYYCKDSKKTIIVLEPSKELVGYIQKYLAHGVFHA